MAGLLAGTGGVREESRSHLCLDFMCLSRLDLCMSGVMSVSSVKCQVSSVKCEVTSDNCIRCVLRTLFPLVTALS